MNEYSVQGIGIAELVDRFDTPLYVYDGAGIERAYRDLRARLHEAIEIFYSLKPNPNVSVVKVLRQAGASAEVCSMGELSSALRAGFRPADVLFTGPGKSVDDLRELVALGIRAIICESWGELRHIDELSAAAGRRTPVLLRINPAFGVRGGRLSMAGKPREFGIDEDQVLSATDVVQRHPNVRFVGIHVFTGTRILDAQVVVDNTERILDLAVKVSESLGFDLELVDIGGGIGIPYYPDEREVDLDVLAAGINKAVDAFLLRQPSAKLAIEPGRFLVGPSGVYAVSARYVKESRGERFVITDGGTHQNMSAVGMGTYLKRNFPMALLTDLDRPVTGPATVTGLLLTPTDIIGQDIDLPDVEPGDVIGVFQSGAYGPSASITYMNGQGFPAEVLVHEGKAHLVRSRDTVEDLFTRQIVAEFEADTAAAVPDEDLSAGVREEIARLVGEAEMADDSTLFDDLALDSLSVVNLLGRLEGRFGVHVDPHEVNGETFRTVGSLTRFVADSRRAR